MYISVHQVTIVSYCIVFMGSPQTSALRRWAVSCRKRKCD